MVAGDGAVGIRLATSHRPDIALVDLGLPTVDGYEVARQVRSTLGPASPPADRPHGLRRTRTALPGTRGGLRPAHREARRAGQTGLAARRVRSNAALIRRSQPAPHSGQRATLTHRRWPPCANTRGRHHRRAMKPKLTFRGAVIQPPREETGRGAHRAHRARPSRKPRVRVGRSLRPRRQGRLRHQRAAAERSRAAKNSPRN